MAKSVEDIDIPVPWGHISGADDCQNINNNNNNNKLNVENVNEFKTKGYKCNICNLNYFLKSSLNRHITIKHRNVIKKLEDDSNNITNKKDKNYQCDICKMTYDIKNNLLRHVKFKHKNFENKFSFVENNNWYKCENCDKNFTLWKSLLRHHRTNHSSLELPVKKITINYDSTTDVDDLKYTCNNCGMEFIKKELLEKHVVKYHINNNKLTKLSECSICSYKCTKSKFLYEHYRKVHEINIKKEILNFNTINEFLTWKENEEKRCLNKYVTQHGPRIYKNGLKIKYYYCHRSGYYKQKGNGKRNLKKQGSKKYGKICPSKMLVKIFNNSKIIVEYISSHVGHDFDICHLTLSKNDRINIANKIILKNMTFDDILNEVNSVNDKQNDKDDNKSNNKCIDYLTRKDLHNIVKSFNIKPIQRDDENSKNIIKIKKSSSLTGKKSLKKITNKTKSNNDHNNTLTVIDNISSNEQTINKPVTNPQLYYELQELVILDENNITNASNNNNTSSDLSNRNGTNNVLNTVIHLTTDVTSEDIPLILHTSPAPSSSSSSPSPLVSQRDIVNEQRFFEDQQQEQGIIYNETDVNITFEESKQSYINDLIQFVNDNIDSTKKLVIIQEITKSFTETVKQVLQNVTELEENV